MTDDEKLALKYQMYTYKTEGNPKMRKMMVDRGWIGLGTNELSEEDKKYLKNRGSFTTPFDIISER